MTSRSLLFFSSDDVRSSLDLLDRVIGEFDDGLLSSTESESPIARPPPKRDARQRHRNDRNVARDDFNFDAEFDFDDDDDDESHIEAEIRRLPPPKMRRGDKPAASAGAAAAAAAVLPNRRSMLSDQIDDIFSELTEEAHPPQRRLSPGPPLRPPTAVAAKNDTTRLVPARTAWLAPGRSIERCHEFVPKLEK